MEDTTKKDCFAYSKRIKQCRGLIELVCKYDECKFYRSQEEFDRLSKKLPKVYIPKDLR